MLRSGPLWLKPDAIFDGSHIKTGHFLKIENECVNQIVPKQDMSDSEPFVELPYMVSPGFVDLQVNGGGGILLNDNPSAGAMLEILSVHRSFGTVAIMPTVISDSPEIMAKAVDAAIEVKDTLGLLGLHIEGPHISVDRRGAHKKKFVRPFSESTFAFVDKLRSFDIPVIITLAPEVVSECIIFRLSRSGAIVSLGHSNADASYTQAALRKGARSFTHLFNAMPPMTKREPGIVATAINSDAYTGIIGDGLHVDDEMVKLAINARPVQDRVFIVSDSMPTVGGPPMFDLYGQAIVLKNGKLVDSDGNLSGAHITMSQTVNRFISQLGIAPKEALKMAISVPATLIDDLLVGQIHNRVITDLIVLDSEFSYLANLDDYLKSNVC